MKIENKMLGTMTMAFVLGSNFSGFVIAETEKPFEGFNVEDGISLEQLPSDVQYGSIKLSEENNEAAMAKLATITSENAAGIAHKVLAGDVVETELDNENGFLVWEVGMIDQHGQEVSLVIDAGNGHILATELDEKEDREDEHAWWKFWNSNEGEEHLDG